MSLRSLDVIDSLERILVTEDLPTWFTHLHSRAILRKSSKRHFVDSFLAVAVLGGSSKRLLDDLEFFDLIFESLVVRDLRVYAQKMDADVFHYRDSNGLEVDDKKVGKPSVLCVVTASDIGGTREDGVIVLPIGSLGP